MLNVSFDCKENSEQISINSNNDIIELVEKCLSIYDFSEILNTNNNQSGVFLATLNHNKLEELKEMYNEERDVNYEKLNIIMFNQNFINDFMNERSKDVEPISKISFQEFLDKQKIMNLMNDCSIDKFAIKIRKYKSNYNSDINYNNELTNLIVLSDILQTKDDYNSINENDDLENQVNFPYFGIYINNYEMNSEKENDYIDNKEFYECRKNDVEFKFNPSILILIYCYYEDQSILKTIIPKTKILSKSNNYYSRVDRVNCNYDIINPNASIRKFSDITCISSNYKNNQMFNRHYLQNKTDDTNNSTATKTINYSENNYQKDHNEDNNGNDDKETTNVFANLSKASKLNKKNFSNPNNIEYKDVIDNNLYTKIIKKTQENKTKYNDYNQYNVLDNMTETEFTYLDKLSMICYQMFLIITKLHEIDITHNDIKPDNFLVCEVFDIKKMEKFTSSLTNKEYSEYLDYFRCKNIDMLKFNYSNNSYDFKFPIKLKLSDFELLDYKAKEKGVDNDNKDVDINNKNMLCELYGTLDYMCPHSLINFLLKLINLRSDCIYTNNTYNTYYTYNTCIEYNAYNNILIKMKQKDLYALVISIYYIFLETLPYDYSSILKQNNININDEIHNMKYNSIGKSNVSVIKIKSVKDELISIFKEANIKKSFNNNYLSLISKLNTEKYCISESKILEYQELICNFIITNLSFNYNDSCSYNKFYENISRSKLILKGRENHNKLLSFINGFNSFKKEHRKKTTDYKSNITDDSDTRGTYSNNTYNLGFLCKNKTKIDFKLLNIDDNMNDNNKINSDIRDQNYRNSEKKSIKSSIRLFSININHIVFDTIRKFFKEQ